MKYIEALRKAIGEKMEENKNMIVMGQDVREWGGASGLVMGFYEKYKDRIIDTPISEAGTAAIAVGAAMDGVPSLIEYTFADFVLHSMDQIINQAAKINFMSANQFTVPVVFRLVIGAERGYGPTHSQNLESIFMQVPGLTVIYPSHASDAYTLLKAALKVNGPVIFVEHKLLHETEYSFGTNLQESGATVLKEGSQATIVTYGRITQMAMQVAEKVNGIEVIDLRYISPLDYDTIHKSVTKTGRVILLEEGYGYVMAEVASYLSNKAFNYLKAPIQLVHADREVIPVDPIREKELFPRIEDLVKALETVLKQ